MNMKIKAEKHLEILLEKLIRNIQQAPWNIIIKFKKYFNYDKTCTYPEIARNYSKIRKNRKSRENPKLNLKLPQSLKLLKITRKLEII